MTLQIENRCLMKKIKGNTVDTHTFTILSPGKRVRAEAGVETVWIGSTVYPESPVWRVWFDDRLVVDTSTMGLATAKGALAYGMRFVKATRHRPQTRIGPARALVARFADRDGRELELTLRVTDMSAFCAVRIAGRGDKTVTGDLSVTRFPEGSVLLGSGEPHEPRVCFSPGGKVVAFWRHGQEQHIVFFDRPGDLAVRRFGALERIDGLTVDNGRQGCGHLFRTVPFTRAALPAPVFGEEVTPAYRVAFEMMLKRDDACDEFWMMRGEPGEFAVAARRQGAVWQVGCITAAAQTLTVRFEDLWLRMPAELRVLRYTVDILRDPTKNESGDRVDESFDGQAPDVRVALDLSASGGFLLTFKPE